MDEYACPNCQKPIYDEDALLCHFCGGSLKRAGKGFMSNLRYPQPRFLWGALIFLILLSFIILYIL